MVIRVDFGAFNFTGSKLSEMILKETDSPIEVGFQGGTQRKLIGVTSQLYLDTTVDHIPARCLSMTVKPLDVNNAPLVPLQGTISGGTISKEVEIHFNNNYDSLPAPVMCPNGVLISQVGALLEDGTESGNMIGYITFIFED